MNVNTSIRTMAQTALLAACLSALSLPALAGVVSTGAQAASEVTTKAIPATTKVLRSILRPVFYGALAKDAGPAYNLDPNGCAVLPKQALKACFDSHGAHFTGAAALSLHLVAFGRDAKLAPVSPVYPEIHGNRVSYTHGNLSAWWRVLPMGFEQGFTLAKRPGGNGVLTLALAADGKTVQRSNGTLGWGKLRYGKLVVTDAHGKVIPAKLKHSGNRILIAVNDTQADYPLTVDPLVWLEQKVTASDGAATDQFGTAVALDGTTAFIAAPFATVNGSVQQGAVYVFTEADGVWSQTQKLTVADGAAFDEFGSALALHGTTALIGSSSATVNGNTKEGKAYFFTKLDGTWTQFQEVTASDGGKYGTFGVGAALGNNVAFVSAGGTTVTTSGGTSTPIPSSVYVFTKSNGSWGQTQKIPSPNPAGDEFGYGTTTIAISGTKAVVGAYAATINGNQKQGNATVYTESGGTWAQTQQLTSSDGHAGDFFGVGVAIQGNTILVGAERAKDAHGEAQGAVYVFTNSGEGWTQTQRLSASDGATDDNFGSFTALDGSTALIGAVGYNALNGAAYIFTKSNGTWTQTLKLVPSDQPTFGLFGLSGGLSGTTALIGAHGVNVNGNAFQGAAYFYGESDLGLAVSAPVAVTAAHSYVSQTIATNNSSAATPAVALSVTIPAAASFVSAKATQGSCSEDAGMVTCNFGQIGGNAGTATANVTLKAPGNANATELRSTAAIIVSSPPLTASAVTQVALLPVDLAVAGNVSPTGAVHKGDNLAYAITVKNLPDAKGLATGAQLTYKIPQGVNYLASSGAVCALPSGSAPPPASGGARAAGLITGVPIPASVVGPASVVCDLGSIAPQQFKSVKIAVHATAAASSISGTFTASAREPDSYTGDNTLKLDTVSQAGPPGPTGPAGPQGPKGSKGSGGLGWLALLALLGLGGAVAIERRRK